MQLHTLQRGSRRFYLNEYTSLTSSISPFVQNWVSRVIKNGGARPSEKTVETIQTFYSNLLVTGLYTKMISVNCFVPDNLSASLTPLIANFGNDPWTNSGFPLSALSVNGIQGDSSHYLDTGCVPSTCYANSSSAGLTVFNMTDNVTAAADIAGEQASFVLYVNGSGATKISYFDCWNQAGGRINNTMSPNSGLISANRTSISSSAIYRVATGGFTEVTSSLSQANVGTLPARNVFVFARNNAGAPASPTDRQFSFAAVHLGLTAAETQTFYNIVREMRVGLGGGYV